MKIISKILLSTVFLVIAGCSTTPQEMRAEAGEKGVIQIDLPFNVARENFLRQAQKCYSGGFRASYAERVVKDVAPGEFTTLDILHKGALPTVRVTHSFDIKKSVTGGTEISWFIAGLIVAKYQPVVESWAKGLEGKCGTVFDK
jgi:hypothetical protein